MPERNNDLMLYLKALLEAPGPLPDELWLPAAIRAAGEPAEWVRTFSELDIELQHRLLAAFSGDGANIYSDALLTLLVEQRAADAETLAMLTGLARRLGDRHRDRMALLAARIARLDGDIAAGAAGMMREYAARLYDLRAELERRVLARPDAWELLNAEMELGRIQWDLACRSDDLAKRAAGRDASAREIRKVEDQIAAIRSDDDALRRRLDEVRSRREPLAAEAEALRREVEAGEAETQSAHAVAAEARHALDALRGECARLKSETAADRALAAELETERRQCAEAAATIRRQLDAARSALAELQAAPELKRDAELAGRLEELLKLLPPDDASRRF